MTRLTSSITLDPTVRIRYYGKMDTNKITAHRFGLFLDLIKI